MSSSPERVGRLLREQVSVEPPADDGQARAELVKAVQDDARRVRRRKLALVALAPALAVLVLWLGLGMIRRNTPSFRVGSEGDGEVGSYYAPPADAELALHFWEGSAVSVAPSGAVRVSKLEQRGATVMLETGKIHVRVRHRPDTRWQFVAGPYSIRVTGTAFWATWKPQLAELEIQMENGSVMVTGPGLDPGVVVADGRRFVTGTHAELSPAPSASAEVPAVSASASAASAPSSREPVQPPPSDEPGWTTLATRGEYRRIVELAESRGIDAAIAGASADDLGALSDAARYTGKTALAQRTLVAMRSRFAGSARAKSAAFLLGRMADDGGDAGAALRWYDAYLAEAPGGSLAGEALGRRMLVLERVGRGAEAKSAAETYLQRFPKGAYAARAEELVAQ